MKLDKLPIEIPEVERTPLVNWLLNLVAEQQEIIEKQQQKIGQLEEKINSLDEELKSVKKLKGKPKIRPSSLNQREKKGKKAEKRAGSDKRSKKNSFVIDEKRIIEPIEVPEGATFNGYREYDVQDLILKRYNIRFLRFGVRYSVGKDNSREVAQRIPGTLWTNADVIHSLSTSSV